MQSNRSHIIQRQKFELTAVSAGAGFDLEKTASDLARYTFIPAIEQCFDKLYNTDEHWVIDKIEIDLGSFTSDTLMKAGRLRLITMLEEQLHEFHSKINHEEKIFHGENKYGGNSEKQGYDEKQFHITKPGTEESHILTGAMAAYHALRFFLETGRFPWWFKLEGPAKPEEYFDQEWISSFSEQEKVLLKEILISSEAVRIRLVNHFSDLWLSEFLESIGLNGIKAWKQCEILIVAMKSFSHLRTVFHQHFWTNWIIASEKGYQTIDMPVLIEAVAGPNNLLRIEVGNAIRNQCLEYKSETVFENYAELLHTYLKKVLPNDKRDFLNNTGIEMIIPEAENRKLENEVENALGSEKKDANRPGRKKQEDKTNMQAEDEAIFVPAAGVILLHPFLVELFTTTLLWNGKNWNPGQAPFRAIHILNYLVTGENFLPEYESTLYKILLGIGLDEPLPAQEELNTEEKGACEELLEAVIRHWKVLRNTSPAGLREGFLQREGKLERADKSWKLQLENKAQDILLTHLPWGYSTIKLPWMNEMLHVSWV